MNDKTKIINLKRLIDIGKDKGYVTYEELNDDLPDDIVSSDHIDDVMMMFEELDIMVIDEASKGEIEKAKRAKKKKEKAEEKEHHIVPYDPVRVALDDRHKTADKMSYA